MSAWTKACMEFSNSLKGIRLGRSSSDDAGKKTSKSAPTSPESGEASSKDALNNVKPSSDLTSSLQRVFKLATHKVRAATAADARNGNKPLTLIDHPLLHREHELDVWTSDAFLRQFFWHCAPTERCVLAQVCTQWRRILYANDAYWSHVTPVYDCKVWSNDEIGTSLFYKSLQDRQFDSIILSSAVDQDVSDFVNNFPNSHQFITTLCVRNSNLTDTGLAHLLNKMEGVTKFSISGCNEITEQALSLSVNERMTYLSISDCINIGDESMVAIAQLLPALTEFNLQAYHVTDSSLSYFSAKQAASLTTLRMTSCWEMTNQGVVNIVHALPNLTVLSLSGCSKISDDAIEVVAEKLRKLTSLDLSWCPRLSDTSLEYIACDLSQLQELTLDR